MKTILIILLLNLSFVCFAPVYLPEHQSRLFKEFQKHIEEKTLFSKVIQHIKDTEGLRLNKYQCPAGQPTIGYGHLIKKGENLDCITLSQADSILILDFNKILLRTDENLDYNKRLAIAHFIFNTGEGFYNKSQLKKRVENNQDISIILKYHYYRVNGIYVKSKHLFESRVFELELFNLKV